MILHVTDCFLPGRGGIEVQVEGLASAQLALGDSPFVLTATALGSMADRPYPVRRLNSSMTALRHIGPVLDELSPEVVHVHLRNLAPLGWAAIVASLRRRLPLVVTVHSMWDAAIRKLHQLSNWLAHWSSAPLVLTAVSNAAAAKVRLAAPGVPIDIVPNGITASWWQIPERAPAERGPLHVVSVGRLVPRRKPLALIDALRTAHKDIGLRATIAGTGPLHSSVARAIRQNGLSNVVTLCGWLPQTEVRHLFAAADIFVNPTVLESFGLATLEARTAGVPVIAHAGNGVEEFVRHGREGLLSDSLADALLELGQDAPLRLRIAAHNRSTSPDHCAWPAVVDSFRRCYDQAVCLQTSKEISTRGNR